MVTVGDCRLWFQRFPRLSEFSWQEAEAVCQKMQTVALCNHPETYREVIFVKKLLKGVQDEMERRR